MDRGVIVVLPDYHNRLSQKLYPLDIIIMISQIKNKILFLLTKTGTIKHMSFQPYHDAFASVIN